MRADGSRHPLLVWIMPVALLAFVVAVVVLPRITPGPSRPSTPVTLTRPLEARHRLDVRYTNEYLYDSTYETCDAVGMTQLARKLGVPPKPLSRLARAFAEQNFSPGVRRGPYHGCLDALIARRREALRRH